MPSHFSPSQPFVHADDLDAQLRCVPLPDGFHERMRELVVEAALDDAISGVVLPAGYLQRMLTIGPPSVERLPG